MRASDLLNIRESLKKTEKKPEKPTSEEQLVQSHPPVVEMNAVQKQLALMAEKKRKREAEENERHKEDVT